MSGNDIQLFNFKGNIMSFFPSMKDEEPKAQQEQEQPQPQKPPKIDPRFIIIDGTNLVKLVEDNPDIPVGKTDRGIFEAGLWIASNYNPATGEMH
jgi:hypothetical protein